MTLPGGENSISTRIPIVMFKLFAIIAHKNAEYVSEHNI